jgi:hypothetical protein
MLAQVFQWVKGFSTTSTGKNAVELKSSTVLLAQKAVEVEEAADRGCILINLPAGMKVVK